MASITLKISVVPIEKVVLLFDRIQVWRSSTLDVNGTPIDFAEVTDASTRPQLVENVALYSYTDSAAPTPTSDVWYRIRYSNSVTSQVSEFTEPSQGVRNPALDILSVEDLKTNFLFGIDLTDDAGTPYPDSLFAFYIESAVARVEQEFDVILKPAVIVGEAHDFYKPDYNEYVWTQLDHRPIVSVEKIELVLPTEVRVIDYDPNSFQIDYDAATVEVVPGSGQITLGQTGAFLPLVFGGQDYLPRAIRVDYTAGFSDSTTRGRFGIPQNIVEYVGMLASEGPLGIAGDLIVGAGIAAQSISLDGLSQSINTTSSATNSGYGARINQYRKQRQELAKILKRAFTPSVKMVVG